MFGLNNDLEIVMNESAKKITKICTSRGRNLNALKIYLQQHNALSI